jgi:hypothetical protein
MHPVTCQIQWVDKRGNPTPDNAAAVGYVRREAFTEVLSDRTVHYEATEWFPICHFHKQRLTEPSLHRWTFKPISSLSPTKRACEHRDPQS